MKKRDIIEVTIEDLEFGGYGISHAEDIEIKTKGTIPGQKARILIKTLRKGKAEGKLLNIIEKSPYETESPCNHFDICGGCTMLTLNYEKQLEIKKQQVLKLLHEANHTEITDLQIVGSPIHLEYKNKMEYTFGDEEKGGPLNVGLHITTRPNSIIQTDTCKIINEDYRKILELTAQYFREKQLPFYKVMAREGYLRNLVIRQGYNTKELFVNIVTTTQIDFDMSEYVEKLNNLKLDGKIVGIMHTKNDALSDAVIPESTEILYGQDTFNEIVLGKKFIVSPFSFFQTNTKGAETLYSEAINMIHGDKKVIFDLYSGTGTIGILASEKSEKVIGIEIIEEAVEMAKLNAKLNNINNVEFIAGDVKEEVSKISNSPELIILDPPRSGIHPKAMGDIISFNAKEILYVSCNPKALVIDLKHLKNAGYEIKEIKCVDQFPNTPHVESVVLMTKVAPTK